VPQSNSRTELERQDFILSGDCIQFEMKTRPSKYCTTPTLRIEYSEYGDPHGPPLILLHGFPDAPVAWSGVIAGLRTKGLRILVPCLRGYGKTEVLLQDLIGGQEAALGMDLLEFADALELETFHLAGHENIVRGVCVRTGSNQITACARYPICSLWREGTPCK
jgi:hypothetical protein